MKLRKVLEQDRDLYAKLHIIESNAKQILEYSQGGAQHLSFTPHGLSHISAVEENYNWLLSDNDISDNFSLKEIFYLLVSTFFHDASMIPPKPGMEEHTRKYHAQLAHTFLEQNKERLQLSVHEAFLVGQIILGHADFESIEPELVIKSDLVNIKKLAACLSMADICHADYTRAPDIVFKYLELNQESLLHWRKHMQISGITRKGNILLMDAVYYSENGLNAISNCRDEIERQLKLVSPYFDSILSPISRIELHTRKLNSELDTKIRFKTNTESILNILIEGVYQRDDVFIRELVQNGLDACHLKAAKSWKRNEAYEPKIVITILNERGKLKGIRIDDNGIGMDIIDVKDTVLWIGNSVSTKSDVVKLLEETTGKNLIAKFGIGLLSCFKPASKIYIRSKKENSEGLEVILTTIHDEMEPQPSNDGLIGSTFILEFKEGFSSVSNIEESIKYYFRMIKQVSLRVLKLDWNEDSLQYDRAHLMKISSTEGEIVKSIVPNDQSDSFCNVEISGDDYMSWFNIAKGQDKNSFQIGLGKVIILNEGVYVSTDASNEWLYESLKICSGVINFSAQAIQLPVSRTKVIDNTQNIEKKLEIMRKVLDAILNALIEKTKDAGDIGKNAALAIAYMYTKSTDEIKKIILKCLDGFHVRTYKQEEKVSLLKIRQSKPPVVYIEYRHGNLVSGLTMFGGRQLYHKPDDVTELQAAMFQQEGSIVISANRMDASNENIIEVGLLTGYFSQWNIKVVDLKEKNLLKDKIGVEADNITPEMVGGNVQFHSINGLPNSKSWLVGNQVWVNIANPEMNRIYKKIVNGQLSKEQIRLFQILVSVLAYKFDDASNKLLEIIIPNESNKKSK